MVPEHAKAISEFLSSTLEMEAKTTARVISAVPAIGVDYAPDAKSMKALDLAWHIASAEVMLLDMAIAGGDAPVAERAPGTDTAEGVVAWYQQHQPAAMAKVRALTGEHLAKVISVWGGAFTLPTVSFVAFALNHSVHHRGQLSAYLRPMGAKVPSIYGPSGDEGMGGH
ncbi:MAG: DinB family protein [Bryobacteraceae bacterium]|nr:DinB family protein [Bryobacteraceae bacterium]